MVSHPALMPATISFSGTADFVIPLFFDIGIPLLILLILMPLYFFVPAFLIVSIYSMVLKKPNPNKE